MKKQRLVIKIGSSSLTKEDGSLSFEKLIDHVQAISELVHQGHEVIFISSGAVAAGFKEIGYPVRPNTLEGRQASAAVGQGMLMQAYAEAFRFHSIKTGQMLLTRQNFSAHEDYKNVHAVLEELLKRQVLPIINENDSVSVKGLMFGDNDMLSALVSGMVHADLLIMLTDINGLYATNPVLDPLAKKYDLLSDIDDELLSTVPASTSKFGTGGMHSKLQAAKTALSLGVRVFVGNGSGRDKLTKIIEGYGDGTYIGTDKPPVMKCKKQWINLHSSCAGVITIDDGAKEALLDKGRSLLAAGITKIEGTFSAKEVVEVHGLSGENLGKGQVNYSHSELTSLSVPPQQSLTVIHRDNWVALAKK